MEYGNSIMQQRSGDNRQSGIFRSLDTDFPVQQMAEILMRKIISPAYNRI